MILHPVVIGIDVSKHHLDLFDPRSGSGRIANTLAAVEAFTAPLSGTDSFVVFEATGSYDALLRHALAAAGIAYARVNPEQARAFARALGQRAKTDPLDARLLAAFGRRLMPQASPAPDPARERLALWHKRRDQLVAMRQQERTRLSETTDPEMAALLASHIAHLTQAIAVEAKLQSLIAADADLRRTQERLRTVPGIGPVGAITLLSLLPELGRRSPKAIAALAGLAPFNHDSGQRRGSRQIRGGRKRVRDALYMAAVTAARSHTRLGAFARTLRDAGKPPKLVLIALARKILVILNAIIRDQTTFQTT